MSIRTRAGFLISSAVFIACSGHASPPPSPAASPPLRGWDVEQAALEFEQSGTLPALARATAVRRSLGQLADAERDATRFYQVLATGPKDADAAAAAFLDDALDASIWSDSAAWESELRRFLKTLPKNTSSGIRLRAEVQLAAHLWQRSCPIAGDHGACIQRIDGVAEYRARLATEREAALRSGRSFQPDPCYEPPLFRFVVHKRDPALAHEAQDLVKRALGRSRSLSWEPGSPLDDAIAHALFLDSEPHMEAALKRRLPPGFDLYPHHRSGVSAEKAPKLEAEATRRMIAWMKSRFNLSLSSRTSHVKEEALYDRLRAHPASRWAAAAPARIGLLLFDLEQYVGSFPRVPLEAPPKGWPQYPAEPHCTNIMVPWEEAMQTALAECMDASFGWPLEEPITDLCRVALERRYPYLWSQPKDFRPAPTYEVRLGQERVLLDRP